MNGTVIFVGIALFFIISGLINFVGDLEYKENSNSVFSSKEVNINEKEYYGTNVVGEQTIILNGLSTYKKREIWNKSPLKSEMMNFFPNFSLMSEFVEDRVVDDSDFKKKLLEKIKTTGEKYIGGAFTAEKAKAALSSD